MPDVIAERFEIERLVGSGGMGEVFRARDRLTGGAVAVKVLHQSLTGGTDRFRREAQFLAEISHPRVVRYVAHGVVAGQRPYLAMEWLEGEDLGQRLERSGLDLGQSITIARRIAEGLAALHDRGVVHRDIKPSNVFLVGGHVDEVKLLDLGVARFMHASRPSTRSGVMVGTPGYMAPEQARGAKDVDMRADVFSLGCVLFECMTGRPAFAGDNIAALLAKILLESPPSVRECGVDVPMPLDDLVTRMLSKHAAARPPSGAAVLRELDPFGKIAGGPRQRASQPVQKALTGSERRLVSVVMASFLKGEAPEMPVEETGPGQTAATLETSFDPVSVVAAFGAQAEVLADGSIVVTLSGKGASDQVSQAARCALSLRSHLIDADIALATGLATVTGRSYVGDVIERAVKLIEGSRETRQRSTSDETLAGQTPVFLDETTAGLLDMRFDVAGDERGLFIRGLRDREAKPRTLLGKPTPFVGRDRELGTLLGIFEESISEPVARAVLVTGPPGAGKSRITSEFLRRISEQLVAGTEGGNVEVWMARGDPLSEGSPFSLLARGIRRAAGINGAEPLVVRQQKLRARVGRNADAEDVTRITEFVGEMANIHFPDAESLQLRAARQDSILMGDQMRRAFCDLVLAETRESPLVILLEDLHWGDLPSVSFIDSALRAAAERPLVVLAVARNEVHEQFPLLWEQRSVQEIRLGPLVRRAGERLVREVLGQDATAEDVARLLDRAAGNVFYLEELIRAYAEGRSANRPATQPGSTPSLDADAAWSLPGTVLAMVEARLERLDPMARRVLRASSIFGELFWRGGILALTGGDYKASEVDDWLSELVRREIIQRRDVSRFPAEQEYAFRHALVRDAAYQMLTGDDRALGHRLAAEWLVKTGEHEPIVLAEHFERGASLDKASAYYARAAEQALEGNDFAAATMRATRALAAGATGEPRGHIELLLAEAARWSGDHEATFRYGRSAMTNLPRSNVAWFVAAAEAFESAITIPKVDEALAVSEEVASNESDVSSESVSAICRVAARLIVAGYFDRGNALLSRVERSASELVERDPSVRGHVLATRVIRAKWLGDIEDAVILAQEAVGCFELVGDTRNAARHKDIAGHALVHLGAFTAAESMLKQSMEAADRMGLANVSSQTRLHLGQVYSRQQRHTEAVRIMEDVVRVFAAQGDRVHEGIALGYLAGTYHLAQNSKMAQEIAQKALPLLGSWAPYRAGLLGLIALSRADSGDAKGAVEAGTEAMRLLEQVGGAVEAEAIVRVGYAEGLRAAGDIEGSKLAITDARARLLAQAAKIKNPEWRKGFMERLGEHVRILARAAEWLS